MPAAVSNGLPDFSGSPRMMPAASKVIDNRAG